METRLDLEQGGRLGTTFPSNPSFSGFVGLGHATEGGRGPTVLEPPEYLVRALLLVSSALPSSLFLPSCGNSGSRIRNVVG